MGMNEVIDEEITKNKTWEWLGISSDLTIDGRHIDKGIVMEYVGDERDPEYRYMVNDLKSGDIYLVNLEVTRN